MPSRFHHEEIYRGAEQVARLGEVRLVLCGAGAVGSQLAENLARQGFRRLKVIDRDRVEAHNVSTQVYGHADVGGWKVEVLKNRLFRAVEIEIECIAKELGAKNARGLLHGADIAVDTFDNSASRRLVQEQCRALGVDCLHVGLFADYCETIWDQQYRVPQDTAGDVCDYPLARNLVLLAVAIASETLVSYVLDGRRVNRTATLRDLAVRELESGY